MTVISDKPLTRSWTVWSAIAAFGFLIGHLAMEFFEWAPEVSEAMRNLALALAPIIAFFMRRAVKNIRK